jgi:hypothetical protein
MASHLPRIGAMIGNLGKRGQLAAAISLRL